MEQKFVKFEEAIEKLGVTPERLNQLREDGELRAYRDGASWKFRADEIDRMASDGVPEPAPPSDIGLVDRDELVDASPLEGLDDLDDLKLADDDDLSLGGSELELAADQEDTVTAGASDVALNIHADTEEGSDPSDSILLSEEALGESVHAPSTIIGRSEVEGSDLELVTEDDDLAKGASDVQLAAGASNVLSSNIAGSGVLDELERESGNTSAFENLEELEIDLAAESSRILSPQDIAESKPKTNIATQQAPDGDSDLKLGGDMLAGEDEGTDPVPEELAAGSARAKQADGPTSDLELATDEDDFVLAGEGGSDITLDSGDSGINLVSPSDSGLALDDIPLEIGGSAILDSLSMGNTAEASDLSLVGSDPRLGQTEAVASLQTDDAFRLTPLGEADEDGDSSSQVIALDANLEDLGAGDAGILGDDAFAEEGVVLEEEYGEAPVGDFAPAAYVPAARAEGDYSVWNIVGLGSCTLLLLLAVVLMLDMVRNISSWDSNLALNDSLLDSMLGLFGLR
jgi:hypothetical protein